MSDGSLLQTVSPTVFQNYEVRLQGSLERKVGGEEQKAQGRCGENVPASFRSVGQWTGEEGKKQ